MSPTTISLVAVCVSVVSLCFGIWSWRQANRPLVTARVTTVEGGSEATALNIVVENTGNRPAREVILTAKLRDVRRVMTDPNCQPLPSYIQRTLFADIAIPVLSNGASVPNSFGFLSRNQGGWVPNSSLWVKIKYRDLGPWRRYRNRIRLYLADDQGFAQTFWSNN